jgi:hypothetical protein
MGKMALQELKAPKNFEDTRKLIEEYDYMKQLIKRAENGKTELLSFVSTYSEYDGPGNNVSYDTLDHTGGQVFANCLKERCKLIEKLISQNI